MWSWIKALDRVLRGEATRLSDLREETVRIPAVGLAVVIVVLGMIYGACMGCFALFNVAEPRYLQTLATTLKVPALFLLTLVVTFPSLYVFNAMVGSRLSGAAVLRLLIASLGVNLAVLASLGPIVAFFSVCSTSYPFMVLLNVVMFALSGVLGLTFLLQTLHRISIARRSPSPPPPSSNEQGEVEPIVAEVAQQPGPLERMEGYVLGRHVKTVFTCWVLLFGLVGAQMSWVLRPFVGDPNLKFEWFRPRASNFFEAVLLTVRDLFF